MVKKVAATALSRLCEEKKLLHLGQFKYRKQKSAINAMAKLIYTTEKAREKKKHLEALFLDVKGAFNYMAKNRLLSRMKELNIPSYLIKWTNSFLSKRRV
jgi:Reverse transcriptase (RNA-dependent DNA polymerase)